MPADLKLRESLRVKLPALLATEFPEVRGRVKLLPNGPPVPYPVQFRVVGVDPLLLNRPFGFVALLGVIALMGMIQRNSVILIDQIEQDRARGVPDWEAIVESTVRRLRPIVLTAAAAVLAMIPLSRSVFWGPMAVAIMGGLVVATVLTLLALPAMYAAWFRVKRETNAAS